MWLMFQIKAGVTIKTSTYSIINFGIGGNCRLAQSSEKDNYIRSTSNRKSIDLKNQTKHPQIRYKNWKTEGKFKKKKVIFNNQSNDMEIIHSQLHKLLLGCNMHWHITWADDDPALTHIYAWNQEFYKTNYMKSIVV